MVVLVHSVLVLDQCFNVCRLRDRGCMSKSGYTTCVCFMTLNY